MTTGADVLQMLIGNGDYSISGGTYEGIDFMDCKPITKKQFEDGFAKYDAWKAKEQTDTALAKAALLERLGITADEAKLLLS